MGQGPSGPRATFVISRGRLFWPEQNGQQAFRQLLFPGNLLASAGRSLSAPSGLLTWFSVPLRTEQKSRRYRERSGVVKGRQRAWSPVCVSLALRAQGLAAAVCDAAGGRESVDNVSLVTLAQDSADRPGLASSSQRLCVTGQCWKTSTKQAGQIPRLPIEPPWERAGGPQRFWSGRCACARMCARVSRNAQVTPATRQRSPYFLGLPSEGHRLLREEIDHNSESPSPDCTCPELTSFISRKQFYLIASWSF